ncbi:MAG: long-chain fatty acid--CoA ligase [Gemmatimonadota bacterium]|jgi:long-chain acyl-CoA synthetase
MARHYASNPAELPRGTLAELFLDTVARYGDEAAFRYFVGDTDQLRDLSYRDAHEHVKAVVGALRELGLERGDRVALLSKNRPAWALTDYGCVCAGVVDVPIYDTLTAPQVAYILEDSGARAVFVADEEQMEKALRASELCPQDLRVVVFDEVGGLPDGVMGWKRDFLEAGRERFAGVTDEEFDAAARKARPEEVTTLIYTSGTTGDPKGVMLTHQNLFSNVVAAGRVLGVTDDDVTLSFLPLSHVLQRMVDYLLFSSGCTIAYAHDIRTVADDLVVVRPSIVVSVPRLYEKVYNAVMEVSGPKARIVQWAREVGAAWAEETLAGRRPTAVLKAIHALADRLVYRKIRDGVGGRLRFFVSGGAPLEPAINRFFYGAGITILEGYGLTETSPVTNVNPPGGVRIGTVGPPIPGTEIRIAEDGEILVRGPQVMKGYYGMEEATREAIDDDGWFRTGDIGELDDDGYLRITDRKKDIIVTAGGKNVAPQPLENRLKTNNFVEQLVMVGDRRKFVALLVVPAFGPLESWAREQGIGVDGREALIRDERVQGKMEEEVLGGLGDLASYETPKKIALLTEEFTVEGGTLTPTQKVKRREVQSRYARLIDRFYEPENVDRTVFVEER